MACQRKKKKTKIEYLRGKANGGEGEGFEGMGGSKKIYNSESLEIFRVAKK